MLKTVVSACAFTMLVCTGTASAQDRLSDRIFANAMVGIGTSRAGASTDAVGAVGFRATNYLSINGEGGSQSFKPYGQLTGLEKRAYRIGGDARFELDATPQVRPFISAGLGNLVAKRTTGGSVHDWHTSVGMGVNAWPTSYLGFGAIYRAMFVDNGTNHYFTAGIVFGKR